MEDKDLFILNRIVWRKATQGARGPSQYKDVLPV